MMIGCENLSYDYLSGTSLATAALREISFNVPAGARFGIAGCSGSGKTTLLQLLGGLLRPTAGRVLVDGLMPGRSTAAVGLVLQHPEQQFFEPTVRREIAFALSGIGLDAAACEARVVRALRRVGLSEPLLDVSPFRLSGGEQRRVALAAVLVAEPAVLALDEPTAGLDPQGRREILALLDRLQRESGCTLLLATHRMEELAQLSEQMLVLHGGRVAVTGATRQLLDDPDVLRSAGLEPPQIVALLAQLRRAWPELPLGLLGVEEARQALRRLLAERTREHRDVA